MGEQEQKAAQIAELFGLSPENELFIEAVTHPSFAHETPAVAHNQRLEFLGDAILDFVVSEQLFLRYPDSDEGLLTRMRAQVVSTGALAKFARHRGVGAALRFGKGAAQGNLLDSDNVLADAVEALIAAGYLSQGIALAQRVAGEVLAFGLEAQSDAGARDAKSELQEKVQALGMKPPGYRVVGTRGPAHESIFEVEVTVGGEVVAQGTGRSKRAAEREAAQRALDGETYKQVAASEPEPIPGAGRL